MKTLCTCSFSPLTVHVPPPSFRPILSNLAVELILHVFALRDTEHIPHRQKTKNLQE